MQPTAEIPVAEPKAVIKAVRTEGELCAEDSVSSSVSSDGAALTLVFSAAEVQSGDDGSCKIELDLELSPGYQFQRLSLHSSGYVFSEQGGASLEVTASFPGSGEKQRYLHDRLSGDDSYLFSDTLDSLWSPCDASMSGRPVELVFELVARSDPEGYLSFSAIDLDFDAARGVSWRRCEKP
jgi:hypothetical protein